MCLESERGRDVEGREMRKTSNIELKKRKEKDEAINKDLMARHRRK